MLDPEAALDPEADSAHRPPKLPIRLRDGFDCRHQGANRGENAAESFLHNLSFGLIHASHRPIWALIDGPKQQQALMNLDFVATNRAEVKQKTRAGRLRNGRIVTLVDHYLDDGDWVSPRLDVRTGGILDAVFLASLERKSQLAITFSHAEKGNTAHNVKLQKDYTDRWRGTDKETR